MLLTTQGDIMDAEQAWQAALGQLEMGVPKASFDAWVRDTRVVSYYDGLFRIGTQDACARDWLESRLTSTVRSLLMGIMNRSVVVQFVVEKAKEAEEGKREEGKEKGVEEKHEMSQKNKNLQMEALYDPAYDGIVRPDRVTAISRYFLRHLRLLGPDLGWLYLGFRQAAFNAGGRQGKKVERFSGKELSALSGIRERTFWNWIGRAETWEKLKGLVSTSASPGWDLESATPRRLPRRYVVSMTLPLTAADSRSLRAWLEANTEPCGGLEKAVETAVKIPINELLPLGRRPAEGDEPETVMAILRELFADTIPHDRLALLETCLQNHIMPDNDRIAVTHFFVQHVLPHLGPGPGWLVTLLRFRGYNDRKNRLVRDVVRLPGGYAEAASWIGVAPETIWRWMYTKHIEKRTGTGKSARVGGRQASEVGKLTNPVLRVYLREIEAPRSSRPFATATRTFQVLMDEIPLEMLAAALDNRTLCGIADADNRAVCSIQRSDNYALCNIGFAQFAEDNCALCSKMLAQFAEDICTVCRVFKSLNHLKPLMTNDSESINIAQQEDRETAADLQSLPSAWNLEYFFRINRTSQKMKSRLRSVGATGKALVAWMLFATSIDPTAQKLDDPYGFALSQLPEYPLEGRDANFDTLASLPPRTLVGMLAGTGFDNPHVRLFESLMGNGRFGQPRYRILLPILTGTKRSRLGNMHGRTYKTVDFIHS